MRSCFRGEEGGWAGGDGKGRDGGARSLKEARNGGDVGYVPGRGTGQMPARARSRSYKCCPPRRPHSSPPLPPSQYPIIARPAFPTYLTCPPPGIHRPLPPPRYRSVGLRTVIGEWSLSTSPTGIPSLPTLGQPPLHTQPPLPPVSPPPPQVSVRWPPHCHRRVVPLHLRHVGLAPLPAVGRRLPLRLARVGEIELCGAWRRGRLFLERGRADGRVRAGA
jgi:hypothetical protein